MSMTHDATGALRAILIALVALAAAIAGAVVAPDVAADLEIYLWLLATIPAFLLAYHRGWAGVATALAGAMVALVAIQASVPLLGRGIQNWPLLSRVLLVFLGTSVGIGTLSEMLHRARSRLDQVELVDPSTGLPNRRYADLILAREFAAAERGRPLTIVLFEPGRIAERKTVREMEKIRADAVRDIGRALGRHTRRMDLSAWSGGQRFLCILSSGDPEGARVFADRIRAEVRATTTGARGLVPSAGIAGFAAGMTSPGDLIRAADYALYQAQRAAPGGGIRVYEPPADTAQSQEYLDRVRALLRTPGRPGPEPA
ncbi:MAG TPA: GGDEF domain-containing protein [Longimicrobiales bacterium]